MDDTNPPARHLAAIVDPAAWPEDEDPRIDTSLQGYLDVSYAELVQAFGQPGPGDGYKVDAEWTLMFEGAEDGSEPVAATIYNYKTGPNYGSEDALPVEDIRDWHIGGVSPDAVDLVRAAFRERVPEPASVPDGDDPTKKFTPAEVLDLPLHPYYDPLGNGTIRTYLAMLLRGMWESRVLYDEAPTAWMVDLAAALSYGNVIETAFDDDAKPDQAALEASEWIIREAIDAMLKPCPVRQLTDEDRQMLSRATECMSALVRLLDPEADNDE